MPLLQNLEHSTLARAPKNYPSLVLFTPSVLSTALSKSLQSTRMSITLTIKCIQLTIASNARLFLTITIGCDHSLLTFLFCFGSSPKFSYKSQYKVLSIFTYNFLKHNSAFLGSKIFICKLHETGKCFAWKS